MFRCCFLCLPKAQDMQSALKKQEKVWKSRMQKLGASYLDQLKDVGYNEIILTSWCFSYLLIVILKSMGKLQSLEQSLHEQKDHDSQQALLSQQLASFHQVCMNRALDCSVLL